MSDSEFTLPDVGEGLTEAEIVQWRVKPGDTVEINQVLVEIETAKSLVELPSPFAGTVSALLADEGQTVEVGSVLIRVAEAGASEDAPAPAPANPETTSTVADTASSISTEASEEKPGAVLVGYGIKGHGASRRRKSAPAAEAPVPDARATTRPSSVPAAAASSIIAKPPIRKLAKDLGVDLAEVLATGLAGEITRDDVIRQASQASVFRNIETPAWSDEREEIIPVKGMRKAIATAMTTSAFTAPHVSVFVDIDATRTMEFVKRLKNSPDFAGIRVSPLLIAAKALIWAVRRNPMVNSTFTDKEITVHHYVNLGIAAATPRGLVVPNVKDAQELSLRELAMALEALTITARDGKTSPAQMSGGTITITNLGSFGMDTGTPILNPGEVGIIALGTIKQKPWVVDGEVRPRFVTTLGGSFDHRVVDGDVVSRFVADVASILEEPALLLD
ncbi:2-oxo acid dehydrogenase subunit E2 [Glaciihabitans arcticus]|uniref:Dihydrolipoamide acetyltransferase component of pyruvate dehydrogenase complex n=1 Tax=Glaciihabitans arcticus TaxID=2668039 RepID=A0A4Q9GWZ4_9MICO|nr:dihydrolipoamide acetyltransferase family protein [Glaciihabitans arcticus]TBN58118.1 2-oxo acid dehydrogenase subunit E2 [Glaciihabitans arcticus]